MLQGNTTRPTPNVAELALSMAASGKSWEEFTNDVADKVADRLIGLIPDKRKSDVPSDSEKPLRGVRALCHHYGMPTATLNKLMKDGKIPHRQVGNRYLFYVSEVDEALKGGMAL